MMDFADCSPCKTRDKIFRLKEQVCTEALGKNMGAIAIPLQSSRFLSLIQFPVAYPSITGGSKHYEILAGVFQ